MDGIDAADGCGTFFDDDPDEEEEDPDDDDKDDGEVAAMLDEGMMVVVVLVASADSAATNSGSASASAMAIALVSVRLVSEVAAGDGSDCESGDTVIAEFEPRRSTFFPAVHERAHGSVSRSDDHKEEGKTSYHGGRDGSE